MQELKIGDLADYNGFRGPVENIQGDISGLHVYLGSPIDLWAPIESVKKVIRLTPLTRAKMWLERETRLAIQHPSRNRIHKIGRVSQAIKRIDLVGGYEVAKLYDNCDGWVNGRFIRGDIVRRDLRILGGI